MAEEAATPAKGPLTTTPALEATACIEDAHPGPSWHLDQPFTSVPLNATSTQARKQSAWAACKHGPWTSSSPSSFFPLPLQLCPVFSAAKTFSQLIGHWGNPLQSTKTSLLWPDLSHPRDPG